MTFDDDDSDNICQNCNGSGEGMYDGSRCYVCHGRGEVSAISKEDAEADGADMYYDMMKEREHENHHTSYL